MCYRDLRSPEERLMNFVLRSVLQAAIAGFLLIPVSFAQSTFGSITGIVKDASGAVVPSADITVTNSGTGLTRRATSSSVGLVNVPNLDIGTYTIRVNAKAFSAYDRENLVLNAN